MQHENFRGSPIGFGHGQRFAERLKRINDARLDEGALVTLNCRISAGNVPWFALRVRTGREKAVETRLDAAGIRCLVPLRKGPDLRRRGRVIEGTMMPVIHGYVLVQMLPVVDYLAGLQGVEDVIDVLGGCEKPIRLGNREVSRFNTLAKGGAYDWERSVDLSVAQGERVLIAAGPFFGQHAVVATANRKGRGDVVVAIRLMGGEVPVTVPLALLRKL